MKMNFRKSICFFILFTLLISLIPTNILALNVPSPTTSGVSGSKYFTALPGVYEMGDGYAVIWATSFKGTGYLKYTYNGKNYTVYDEKNNIVRTNDTIHVVKVPHEHLQGNSYTVFSTEVTSHQYAITNYGTTISAGPISMKKYDGGSDFDILMLTDTHGQLNWAKNVSKQFSKDPDLVVFSGDIVDSIETKAEIAHMFNIMGTVTGGRYPVIYCRGNHETRGIYSTAILDYFPTKTGEFYFDFRYGPLWGVVIDTGEDKVDSHEYYGNLANYKEYNLKQEVWLRSLRPDTTADYRLGIYHIPNINTLPNSIDFSDSIAHLRFQIGISGHTHTCKDIAGSSIKSAHHTYVGGGYDKNAGTFITLNNNTKSAYVTSKSDSGAIISPFNNYSIPLSYTFGNTPSLLPVPEYGTNAQFKPSNASKGTVSISVEPTVFETGGDWYNIVWATSTSNSNAKGCAGFVEYVYNGKTYQLFDEVGGYRRSYSNIHTVKVPKAHLDNNSYKVCSFLVEYSYTNPSAQTGRYYSAGDYVYSSKYIFENRSNNSSVTIFACPDVKMQGNETQRLTAISQAVQALGTSPAIVIVNGDATGITLDSDADLVNLFKVTSAASVGIHPVVFSRGNAECRGYNATELFKYIPTVTGEFYYSLDIGEYTLVNLDTAEDDPDNFTMEWNGSTIKKYGNRVTFDALRQEQVSWIESMEKGKLISISHMPLSFVKSHLGCNLEAPLKEKGAILHIGGHTASYSVSNTVNENSIYSITAGGSSKQSNVSTSILLSDEYAHIRAYTSTVDSSALYDERTVSLSDGKTVSYKGEQPPKINGSYVVSTPQHIAWISENCNSRNSFEGETFILANDIDMMLLPFKPIGGNDDTSSDSNSVSNAFSGIFNGNRYKIKNLNIISTSNNVGFFGALRQATVKNVILYSGNISGNWYVGALAGYSQGSIIEDCTTSISVYSNSGSKIGGIVGLANSGTQILRCSNYGSVIAHHPAGNAGGIAGQLYSGTKNIICDSYNRGCVYSHGSTALAGGIFGYAGNTTAEIKNCYNASSILGGGSNGAIAGGYSSGGKITITNSIFANNFGGANNAFQGTNSWSSASGSGTCQSKTPAEMKSQSTATLLNDAVYTYIQSKNEGYPIHKNSLLESEEVYNTIKLNENSKYVLENGYIKGIAPNTSTEIIRSNISNKEGIHISKAGTGGLITLTINGDIVDSAVIVISGDVNGDGTIDSTDYLRIKSKFLSKITFDEPTSIAGDVNSDGTIDSTDYIIIKNMFLTA